MAEGEADGRATLRDIFAVARDGRLTAEELRLWLLYRSFESREHGGFPGDDLLADLMDRSPRSVQGYRAELLEKGYLDQTLRGPKPAHYRAVLPEAPSEAERTEEPDHRDDLPTPSEAVEEGYPDNFEACWELYPNRSGGNPKKAAYRAWRARVRNGADPEELEEGTRRYAEHVRREGMEGGRYVKQAKTFYGPDEWFREEWASETSANDTPYARGRLQ